MLCFVSVSTACCNKLCQVHCARAGRFWIFLAREKSAETAKPALFLPSSSTLVFDFTALAARYFNNWTNQLPPPLQGWRRARHFQSDRYRTRFCNACDGRFLVWAWWFFVTFKQNCFHSNTTTTRKIAILLYLPTIIHCNTTTSASTY